MINGNIITDIFDELFNILRQLTDIQYTNPFLRKNLTNRVYF